MQLLTSVLASLGLISLVQGAVLVPPGLPPIQTPTTTITVSLRSNITYTQPSPFPTPLRPTPIPPSCLTKFRGVAKTQKCYTHTTWVPPRIGHCPIFACPLQPAIVCPLYIIVSTLNVPCHTNCCPYTPTTTLTKSCLGCQTRCVIPTETITQTTGCPTTPTKKWTHATVSLTEIVEPPPAPTFLAVE